MNKVTITTQVVDVKDYENPVRHWAFSFEIPYHEYQEFFRKTEMPVRDLCINDSHYFELMEQWKVRDKKRTERIELLARNIAFGLNEKL